MKGCSGVCSCESNRESKLAALVEEGKVEEREREGERDSRVSKVREFEGLLTQSLQFTVYRLTPFDPVSTSSNSPSFLRPLRNYRLEGGVNPVASK